MQRVKIVITTFILKRQIDAMYEDKIKQDISNLLDGYVSVDISDIEIIKQ